MMNIPSKFKEAKEELICYTKTQINNNSTDTVKATLKGRTTNWLVFVWSKDNFIEKIYQAECLNVLILIKSIIG